MDYWLRFPDKETADLYLLVEDGEQRYTNTDTVGIILRGGEWDSEGNELVPPTVVEGWHVNLCLVGDEKLNESLYTYLIPKPTNPVRVWF